MATTGRPSKLNSIIRRDDNGQPVTCGQLVIDETATGQPLEVVAGLAGVSRTTIGNWLRAGRRVEERLLINPDSPVDNDDLDYRDFLISYERARAEGERRCWELMHTLAEGGVVRRIVEKRDSAGNLVERTLMTETRVPSFQAIAWKLRNGYDRREKLAVAIDQGALSDDERADELATAIESWLEADAMRTMIEQAGE